VEETGRVTDGPALPRGRDDEVVEQAAQPNATADAIVNARRSLKLSVSNTQGSRHDRHESVRGTALLHKAAAAPSGLMRSPKRVIRSDRETARTDSHT
jgi:hypothetical protein